MVFKNRHSATTCLAVFYFMYIPADDSEVEYLLVELMMNDGIIEYRKYADIESRFPNYFNNSGFIPYTEYLDRLLWMPDIKGFCAYMLVLNNGDIYKGYTSSFRRMVQHFAGIGCVTTKRNPPEYILHYQVFDTKEKAIKGEQFFKKYSGIQRIRNKFVELKTIYPPNKQ